MGDNVDNWNYLGGCGRLKVGFCKYTKLADKNRVKLALLSTCHSEPPRP